MKKPYLLIITVILCLVLTGGMSLALAEDSDAETIEACKQAAKKNPDDAKAHRTLGYVYLNLHMYKEAIEVLKIAIKRNPDYAMSYYNLGLIYNLSNDRDSAVEQYEILTSLDPVLAIKLSGLINK